MDLSRNRRVVLTLATGGLLTLVMILLALRPIRAAGPWYVTPGGDDGNDCLSPGAPCATINGAIGKASSGDTIYVATGTYTGSGDQVVLLDKDTALSGGWDEAFTTQSGTSTLDGEDARRCMTVNGGVAAVVECFTIQNGSGGNGAGIRNEGNLSLDDSTVSGNSAAVNGGGIFNGGTLTLNRSTVTGNTADFGGGVFNDGTSALNNSTVSGNMAGSYGGGIQNQGTLALNSSTIRGNAAGSSPESGAGGGIRNDGTAALQNVILAGNYASFEGPDCLGTIDSLGWNLIGSTFGCWVTPSTGDLIDVDARLFALIGLPGYHPLLPGSPAIDAGNPAGCTDHLGNPLTTDQRGIPRSLDGDEDGDAICDMGSYEFDPENPFIAYQVFLPLCTRNYCPDFFDDFSNPASGWDVVDDSYVRTEYLNGEYRVLTKQPGYFYLFKAPTCDRQNYTVEVDARWAGTPGSSYGLIFGLTSDYSRYYLFDMNTDYQQFRLLRRDPTGFVTVVPVTGSSAINGGTASNHLKVTRNGTEIRLEVNGTVLGTWYDGAIGGLTGAGLVTNPYFDIPVSDARFDNFSMVTLPGDGASAPEPDSVTPDEIEFVAPNARRDLVLVDWGW